KILVAGNGYGGVFVTRFNGDGSLDDGGPSDSTPGDSFGDAGTALLQTIATDGRFDIRIAVRPDASIVVSGWVFNFFNSRTAPVLFELDGTDGHFLANIGLHYGPTTLVPKALAIQPDNKVLVAYDGDAGFRVKRYLPDLTVDPAFGSTLA